MMDDEFFECIRCGAQVYHAASQCPHCGLELYPDEIAEEQASDEPLPPLTLRSFSPAGALFISAILAFFLTFAWLPLRPFFLNAEDAGGQAILLLAGTFAALVSGYGDCALLRRRLPLHGWLLGACSSISTVLLSAIWRNVTFTEALFHPLTLAILAFSRPASYAGQLIFLRLFHRANRSTPTAKGENDSLYIELLHRVGFDQARLERLVALERRTAPAHTTRHDLLRRAINRWDRDNH